MFNEKTIIKIAKLVGSYIAMPLGLLFLSLFYALCSNIVIPLPFNFVPLSLQPVPLFITTFIFGRFAVYAYCIYLLQGICGMPFFSYGRSGLIHLFGPTGGYLIGFGIAMIFIMLIKNYIVNHNLLSWYIMLPVLYIANIFIFGFGLAQLSFFVPVEMVFKTGLYPFIIGDFLIKPLFVYITLLRIHITKVK